MRHGLSGLFFLLCLAPLWGEELKLPAELKLKVNRLGKLEAACDTPVKWINLHEEIDLIPDSSGKFAFVMGVKPGRYKVAAYTATKDGVPSEPAYCVIIIEGSTPPVTPNPVPPNGQRSAEGAIVRLRFGNAGCTATIIGPRRGDGRWDILTASHCTGPVGSKGQITLKDGRTFGVVVAVRQTTADISWLIAEMMVDDVSYAFLAPQEPEIGAKVWHMGYGVDKPGNKEEGTVAAAVDRNGQLKFSLSVSSGDSGSGIFRIDTNEVVATVCCTAGMAKKAPMWGGSCTTAQKLRPGLKLDAGIFDEYHLLPIPIRLDDEIMLPITYFR